MNKVANQPSVKQQATALGPNVERSIRPEQVWETLSPSQRQAVYQALVEVGRRLQPPTKREGRDEHA